MDDRNNSRDPASPPEIPHSDFRAYPRLERQMNVLIRVSGQFLCIGRVVNISRSGACIATDYRITLPSDFELDGVLENGLLNVRKIWRTGNHVGVRFDGRNLQIPMRWR